MVFFHILSEEEAEKIYIKIDEKEKIFKVLQYDNVSILKKTIKENNIDKKIFLHRDIISDKYFYSLEPDILIHCIKNNNSVEIIKYIISLYQSLNYFLLKDVVKDFFLTPFLSAIINKRYDIADLLLEHGFEFTNKIKLDIIGQKKLIYLNF